jgi:hypothetical protein
MAPRQLFAKYDIYNVIEGLKKSLKDEYETLPDEVALDEAAGQRLKEKHSLHIPSLKTEQMEYEDNETKVDARNLPGRLIAGNRAVWVDAKEYVIHIPFEGDPGVFDIAPSAFNGTVAMGDVVGQELLVRVMNAQPNFDVQAQVNRELSQINWRLENLRGSLAHMNTQLEHQLRVSMAARKRSIEARQGMSAIELNIRRRAPSPAAPQPPAVAVSREPKTPSTTRSGMKAKCDVFISHASEDKAYVRPLAQALRDAGISVWYDEMSLEWGDNIRTKIDEGLATCRFGIVVLSKAFLTKKQWTDHELSGLFALEEPGKKVILPIWHEIEKADLLKYSPSLALRLALLSSRDSHADIVDRLLSMLGRSRAPMPTPAGPRPSAAIIAEMKKSGSIADAFYETTGPGAERVQMCVRRSPSNQDLYMFENSVGEELIGTREEIALKFVTTNKLLEMRGFKRMNYGNRCGDRAFDL